jgi:hypothetical protein
LSRLSSGVVGYLEPFNPLAGYSRWPRVILARGNANSVWSEPRIANLGERRANPQIVERFVKELMPADSTVTISPLKNGQGGAEVFRLGVKDKEGNAEISRVLKVGPASLIAQELEQYYKYAHNKSVGGAARLDIAKAIKQGEEEWAGLVYIFVGAGELALPWSSWAKTAAHPEIARGLDKLFAQLSCWHPSRGDSSAIKLLIGDCYLDDLRKSNEDWISSMSDPTFDEVKAFIHRLRQIKNPVLNQETSTVVVHGDLHVSNIFALLDADGRNRRINNVAVIDWGSIRPESHPLSDIAKLMADLLYKVRWEYHSEYEKEKKWAFNVLEHWCKRSACRVSDHWKLAFIHQVSKMLFYRVDAGDDQSTYFSPGARVSAWEDLNVLARLIHHAGREWPVILGLG